MKPIVLALRRPYTVMVLVVTIALGGVMAAVRTPVDIFPNLNLPVIYVAQPYGGMDPAQMEGLLTNYYEYHFLYIGGIHHVESRNVQGMALMKLCFHPGTNMAQAMAETIGYVTRSRAFMPPGTVSPFITRFDAGSVPVGCLVLSSATRSIGEIQDQALFKVRPMFAGLPGVSAPPPFGGNQRTVVVRVDPDRLHAYQMSPDEVIEAVTNGNNLEVASAELVRRLRLDPLVVVAPVEPPETLLRLFPATVALDDLIARALHCRPELAEAQALVQVTLTRLKQAKLRPLIPSLAFRSSGGGFGGGPNATFGNFNARTDVEFSLFWELQNLGLADHAIARGRAAEQRIAALELLKVQDRVASEVVAADKARRAADRQLTAARPAVLAARQSLAENLKRTERGAGLPLEALQPIEALAQARADYLDAVLACNRAQFQLRRALGQP